MEQRRKRAIDEKSNHNKNRQRKEQTEREWQHLDAELNSYSKYGIAPVLEEDDE